MYAKLMNLGIILISMILKINYTALYCRETYETTTAIIGSSCKHYQDG